MYHGMGLCSFAWRCSWALATSPSVALSPMCTASLVRVVGLARAVTMPSRWRWQRRRREDHKPTAQPRKTIENGKTLLQQEVLRSSRLPPGRNSYQVELQSCLETVYLVSPSPFANGAPPFANGAPPFANGVPVPRLPRESDRWLSRLFAT